MKHAGRWILSTLAFSMALAFGCKDDAPDRFLAAQDAGADTGPAPDAAEDSGPSVDPTLGGPCNDDAQCNDQVDCTFDACDKALSRCRNTPDDTRCSDGIYCNGTERCQLRQGCTPGDVVTCRDDVGCTIDKCIEATRSCEHVERDSDGDGDPDDHCEPDRDCDDTDPTVNSLKQEVCGNLKDDNCNGLIDETPCALPENDRCEGAVTVSQSTILSLSTVATKLDHPTSCASSITGAQDIVVAITVPAGSGAKDVQVQATMTQGRRVALALETTCGSSATEVQCANYESSLARAIRRSAPAGSTVYAIITSQSEGPVSVKVDLLPPTAPPANETCASPQAIPLGVAVPFSLVDAKLDLGQTCGGRTGELTYTFTLDEPKDVRIYASTTLGEAMPILTFRAPLCSSEPPSSSCSNGNPPLFRRSLPKGSYVFTVGAAAQIDGNVVVVTSPPTTPPADESCGAAPPIAPNTSEVVSLEDHANLIDDGCPPSPSAFVAKAARKLSLVETSDVLVVARVTLNQTGSVALAKPGCKPEDLLACDQGQGQLAFRAHASKRGVPAGDYRVVVADQSAQSSKLIALVRPTVAPTIVASDTCADAVTIPETGGFFTGDTRSRKADYNTGCDASNQPEGGAKDQTLKLTLSKKQRVIFDMSGSGFNSLIDIRQGEPCPGISIPGACNPSFSAGRAFLDVNLDAGTYLVVIDGYSGAEGLWNLDVRVLDPD